jgi:hypothetical protein
MGLVADSLDMLADSFVYGISLFAASGAVLKKKRIAKLAGYSQITLAIIGFMEILRSFFWRRETSRFFNNEYRFDFCTYRKRQFVFTFYKSQKAKKRHI